MANALSLSNQLLIAMPSMGDPNFRKTVTLICEHTADGALGIVINRLSDTLLGDVLKQMEIATNHSDLAETTLYRGGPMEQNRGFVLYQNSDRWQADLTVSPGLALSSSQELLQAIAAGNGPDPFLVALGYAGWGPGQLDAELLQNAWLTTECSPELLFTTPVNQRWQAAAEQLGINLELLSTQVGHG